ncbi:MAG: EAL domain-containing protein [Clostridia bacterium]|nr:EAL domain-containing protein [Clostridia bacterium]
MNFVARYIKQIRKYGIVIAISLILGVFAYSFTLRTLNGMIERSLIEIAKQGAKTVEKDIDWQLENLYTISRLQGIQYSYVPINDKLSLLRTIYQRNNAEFAIVKANGDFISTKGTQYNVSNEEFFKTAMAGQSTVTIPQQGYPTGDAVVIFAVPIVSGRNITGVLCSVYPTEILSLAVEDITFGKNGYGYIIDDHGTTIAHKDRSLVKNRVSTILEAEKDPSQAQLAALEKDMIKGHTGAGQYTYKGQLKYMGYTKINNVPWSFAATAPKSEVYNSAMPVLIVMIFIVGVFGLVLVCINVFFNSLNKKIKKEEQSFKNAVDTANIIVISFLEDGSILEFNRNAEERFGYPRDKVVKLIRIYDLLNDKDQKKLAAIIENSRKGIKETNFELCVRTQKGKYEHVIFNLNTLDQEDEIPSFELMGIDITDRVKSELELIEKHEELSAVYEELAASQEELKSQLDELIHQKILLQEKDERHNLVVEACNIGIWDWDVPRNQRTYSDKWYEIFGVSKEELKGRDKNWMDYVLPEDLPMAYSAYTDHIEGKTPYFECEYRIKPGDGQIKWVYAVGKGLWDQDGKLIKMAGAHSDITTRKEIEERVNKLAYYDTLTGLSNRSQLIENFTAITAKAQENIALVFIDLDNFKLINDSYGHAIGDKLLIEVSRRLGELETDKMHISRLGGDEFAIMVWDYEGEEALTQFIENLILHVEGLTKISGHNINLSTTIGISVYPKDAHDFDELLKNADTAMYKATEKRCKYVYYHKEMNDAILERLNLRNYLKSALDHEEFLVYYQPQFRARDKKIVGFEALMRWKSPTMGMVSPAKFIPVAEESRLIIPLGDWILDKALAFLRKIHETGDHTVVMSINISVIQLIQRNFSDTVIKCLEQYDIPPETLELEITESVMMESVESVLQNIVVLRNKGVRIALDDFGTGYSSLNYLTKLPINTLKIDKSFIDNIGHVKEKSLIIGSIVEIGRKLGLSIVAEGVETQEQYEYLLRRRCERIQGYLFSKPIPEELVLDLITENQKAVGY